MKSLINTEHIICRRYALRMTQVDLAEKVGITKDHVSRIERGLANPQLITVLALCDALKTEPNKVIRWE